MKGIQPLKLNLSPHFQRSSPQALAEPRPEEKQMLRKARMRLQLNKREIKTRGPPDPAAGDYRVQTGPAQPGPTASSQIQQGAGAGRGESPT